MFLARAGAYANAANCESEPDQEQQLWSECSRLLADCIIYYNACILSELLERAERRQDYQRADAIKRANQRLVNFLKVARGRGDAAPD
ncbi:MAG TPA: Tn3 family transposase [Xanthobacteraceae bacterium]|nr:Tn3 family transposase [Xanthobacteraceae bacterium]